MALTDEVRIDESSSKRSQVTGHLLIVMPKLNARNATSFSIENPPIKRKSKELLKTSVDIRNIVVDESEVPPLI